VTDLPQPLTPADCDLRGLPYMPLDVIRLLDSDMFAETTGDELKAALALWCKSWTQVPAASLPNKDQVLAELSRAKNWKKVKAAAMRGWILCADNRWYHPVVAEKALAALPGREEFNNKKSAEAERKARERDDRKALFELLKSHGVVPDWNISTKVLRGLAAQYQSQDLLEHVTDAARDMSQPVTVSKGEGECKGEGELTSRTTPENPAPDDSTSASAVGALCIAMRAAGVMTQPADPRMIALAAQNVTAETVTAACQEAKRSKPNERISLGYVVGILLRWAKDAEAMNVNGVAQLRTAPGKAPGIAEQLNARKNRGTDPDIIDLN
jgi:hypothetical protein